jgi:hypothetical protein
MLQSEIDEISQAFSDAWQEYFGEEMYYVPFSENDTPVHRVYKESKSKAYDFANKILFHGTFKQEPIDEKGELAGKNEREKAEITFVTKELFDRSIKEVDLRAIIEITDRNGVTKHYNILKRNGKVQLGNNHVFTKIEVVDIK